VIFVITKGRWTLTKQNTDKFEQEQIDLAESFKQSLQNKSERGPNDLEYQIEYLTNQNEYLKKSNKKLIEKNKVLEEEFERLLEENNNFRLVRNQGKIL